MGQKHFLTFLTFVTPVYCITHRSVYIFYPDAVPPIHGKSYHVATNKVPTKNGDKFRSIFSDNLQPIATCGKKACSTLLIDQHCGNGCSIKRTPLSVSYYNKISGGHIGSSVVRTRCSAGLVLPLWYNPCAKNSYTWRHTKHQTYARQ